jgi:hypothetical protein
MTIISDILTQAQIDELIALRTTAAAGITVTPHLIAKLLNSR